MRRDLSYAFVGLAGILMAATVVGSAAGSAEEDIKRIELERNEAILGGDASALERMTSDDYTFITQRGELRTKAEIVAGFKAGSYRYSAREVSDLAIRVYGDAAVVTGRARQKGTEKNADYSGENRFTRVYIKQGDKWVTVALQVTSLEKP